MSKKENDLREANREKLRYIERSGEIYNVIMSHPQLRGAKVEDIINTLQAAISRDIEEVEGDFLCDINKLLKQIVEAD